MSNKYMNCTYIYIRSRALSINPIDGCIFKLPCDKCLANLSNKPVFCKPKQITKSLNCNICEFKFKCLTTF